MHDQIKDILFIRSYPKNITLIPSNSHVLKSIVRSEGVTIAYVRNNISNFIGFVLLYGIVVYMPILVVNHFGLTTMYSGLAISTAAGAAALVASQAGRLYQVLSEQNRVLAAFCCCGLSHFMVAVSGSYLMVLASLVVWGLGFGILMPTLNSAAAGLVSSELRAGVLAIFTLLIY